MRSILKLALAIIITQLAGAIGSIATTPAIPTWYAQLQKPWFTPPNWLFAPAWITLFTLMGISLYLVLQKRGKRDIRNGLLIFSAQLLMNILWSFVFFGFQMSFFAFIEIIFLWILIALTIYEFYRIDKRAAYLLVPYILWVTFASALNFYVWILN